MKRFSTPLLLFFVIGISASQLISQTITTASDNGANYSEGWGNGSNGGTGFQAWNIWSSDGTGGSGGNFIGNPVSGGVTGMAANSFSLYANPNGSGAYANAERRLNTSLAIGQTLSFQWSINYDSGSGGNKGFSLYSGGEEILYINNAGSADITCNGGNVGFAYGTNAMIWSFTRTDATTISVTANGRNETDSFSTNIVAASGAIDRVKFYASAMQRGDEAQPYFNNLAVTEPVATSMAVPGDHAFAGTLHPDGRYGTGMTQSSNPATPNLWELVFNVLDAKPISFQFVANGSWDFSWGNDPARPGYAKRGGESIQVSVPATGVYKFTFDQSTLAYSITRANKTQFDTYQKFADFYYLTGGPSGDFDKDGLTNTQEYDQNTDPTNADSDGDSLRDSREITTTNTNPLSSDSDNDTLPDWWEVANALNPNSSTGIDGASGDPDIDSFTNKQEFEGQSNPVSSVSVPANRAITFSIDLSRQIVAGTFSPSSSAVEVWGTFNDWGNFANKYSLTNNGSGTYSGTHVVPGAAGSISRYKFVTFDGNNTLSWEPGSDRVLVMGANGQPISLPVAYLGEVRPVTFSVNMGVQVALGRFVHGTNKVYLVGDVVGSWNVPGTELARVGSSDVYSAEVLVAGAQNATANYKFYANNSLAFETDLDAATAGDQTRVLTLGARDTAETLPIAYFDNVGVVPPNRTVTFAVDMSIQQAMGKFDPATGVVQLRGLGSFDATDKVLTREGVTLIYKGTFVVTGDAGSTVAYKFFSVGVTSSGFEAINPNDLLLNRSLTLGATGSPVVLETAYFSNQSALPPTFNRAYPGRTLSEVAPNGLTYLANYAFGGNETTPATLPVQDTSDPTKLRLVVVFRTDDYTLPLNALGGETTADLADGWSASGVSVENSTDLSPTPANTVRKVISVDRGSDPKKFLRATVTK
jgi:hypothetical protein